MYITYLPIGIHPNKERCKQMQINLVSSELGFTERTQQQESWAARAAAKSYWPSWWHTACVALGRGPRSAMLQWLVAEAVIVGAISVAEGVVVGAISSPKVEGCSSCAPASLPPLLLHS
jgi:hypothetical protein